MEIKSQNMDINMEIKLKYGQNFSKYENKIYQKAKNVYKIVINRWNWANLVLNYKKATLIHFSVIEKKFPRF